MNIPSTKFSEGIINHDSFINGIKRFMNLESTTTTKGGYFLGEDFRKRRERPYIEGVFCLKPIFPEEVGLWIGRLDERIYRRNMSGITLVVPRPGGHNTLSGIAVVRQLWWYIGPIILPNADRPGFTMYVAFQTIRTGTTDIGCETPNLSVMTEYYLLIRW